MGEGNKFFKLMLEISINTHYIDFMNRRKFIQSLAAAFTLPAVSPALASLPAAPLATTSGATSATAMATKARFWAIYMHGLQGNCTPATLSTVLGIPETQARGYVSRLVAEGVIKPNPLIKKTVSKLVKSDDEGLISKARQRLEMKSDEEVQEADEGDYIEVDGEIAEIADENAETSKAKGDEVSHDLTFEENQLDADAEIASDEAVGLLTET